MHERLHGPGGHLAGVAALTLLMLWPALWSGAPTAFFDSANYYDGGGEAVGFFLDRSGLGALLSSAPTGEAGDAAVGGSGAPTEAAGVGNSVRSVPYSVYLNLAIRAAGPMAAVVPMALVTAWLLWLLLAPLHPPARLLAGGTATLATTAPFYASQLMPDIQAAWLIAVPLLVMLRGGAIGGRSAMALGAAATAAILFHYSHIPLAAATGGVLSLWLLWRGRYRAAALAQLPLVLAVGLNLAISVVIAGNREAPTEEPAAAKEQSGPAVSIAPGRLPVLLARLLEDGPALDYLSRTCPQNGFAICDVYDRFPATSHEALWGPDSIRQRATPAQMRRISAEEMPLALQVLAHDPWGQVRASAANTGAQLVRFGLEDLRFARMEVLGPEEIEIEPVVPPPGLFAAVERVQIAALSAALLLLALAALRVPAARAPICLLAVGLLANAFVCGALSAPAGRYQGRVIWLVAATALALWARHPQWRRAPWRAPPRDRERLALRP